MKTAKYGLPMTILLAPSLTVAADDALSNWADRITLSGAIEVEVGHSKDFDDKTQSDVALATVALALDAQINDRISGHVVLLHEDDDTEPMEVDEGVVQWNFSESGNWYVAGGRMYVPFGVFESNLVSDPLTLELGETREAALQLSYENGGYYGSAYVFNGDTIETSTDAEGEDIIEAIGANLGYGRESEAMSYDVSVSYISSIADSDLLQEVLGGTTLDSYVPGVSVSGILDTGPFTFIAEYVGATKAFKSGEFSFNDDGAKLAAYNLEASYGFDWGGKEATVALGFQQTKEAIELELPETRLLIALSLGIYENTTVSFEYARDEDYKVSDDGTGEDAGNFTAQLAVEF